jgi:ABC-type antimicrobial peptide transport system permease subunit
VSAGRIFRLSVRNLSRDRAGALLCAFGVAMGVGALCFFVSLGLGISELVRTKVFPVDATMLEVVPPQVSLGKLFGGSTLDASTVDRLRALPGVKDAFPKMALRVPAISQYDGSFFGSQLNIVIEVVGVGVDPRLLALDVQPEKFKDPGALSPNAIPCVVSSRLLEIYNKSFAPSRHLPRLSPQLVLGFQFPMTLGTSFVSDVGNMMRQGSHLEVVGVSDRAMLAGVTLPLDTVKRLNAQYHLDADTFSSVVLQASSPDQVPQLAQAVRDMGFAVDDEDRRLAEQAGAAVALITGVLALLSALICALAAVNIGQTLFAALRARSREVGVMRAVGATRLAIAGMVLSEAVLMGVLGGALGALLARLLALGADAASTRFLPEFPFKPESFFGFPLWLWALGVGLGALSAALGALLPARAAARLDPARTLAG